MFKAMNQKIFPEFKISKEVRRGSEIIGDTPIGSGGEADSNFIGSSFDKKNLKFIIFFIFFLIAILFFRVAFLQAIKGDYYFNVAEGNRIKSQNIKAKRGIIYDRDMTQLVYNRPNFFLTLTADDFFLNKNSSFFKECWDYEDEDSGNPPILNRERCKENGKNVMLRLFANKGKDVYEEIGYNFEKIDILSHEPIIIVEKISYIDALMLMTEIKNISGLSLEISNTREYLPLNSLSHWIGYTGRINQEELEKNKEKNYFLNDYIGKNGLEKYYEDELRGEDGRRDVEVNVLGEEKGTISSIDPVSGHNLVLSIDYELQKKSEEILEKYLIKNRKEKGVVVALNPENGEILSMISLPAFSANDFSYKIDPEKYKQLIDDKNKPLFNRAVMGEYPSGSIIKPVIAAAALETGTISPWTTFLSTGGISIGSWFFPDWRAGGHGAANVRRAIADSINTFFYITVGGYDNFEGMGIEKMKEYGEKFGLNAKTGIDLPYEEDGFLPTKEWKKETKGEQWYIGDTYHLAIGQGDLLITPLQAAVFTSIIANGGTYYKPHLLKKVVDEENNVLKTVEPTIAESGFISPENIGTVARGMRDCVTYGSCVALNDLPIPVAGKTGTAQHLSGQEPHGWFTAFAPFENAKIALVVLVEEGEGGTKIAAPVAKEILNWYFSESKADKKDDISAVFSE